MNHILIGWMVAFIVTRVAVTLLNAVKFNGLAERSGFASFVSDMGIKADSTGFIFGRENFSGEVTF